MHTLSRRRNGEWLPLFHSKDLGTDDGIGKSGLVRSEARISGPGVLLPRVGQPSASNLSVLPPGRELALSDCVIALLTGTVAEAAILKGEIALRWPQIELAYGGTCAKYITIEMLGVILRRCGFHNIEFVTPKKLTSAWSIAARTA